MGAGQVTTIRGLIRLLNALATKLPLGLESEVQVGIQGEHVDTQIGDHVAVSTLTETSEDGTSTARAFVIGMMGEPKQQKEPQREWKSADIVSHFLTHRVREARLEGGFAVEWPVIQEFAAEIGLRQSEAVDNARQGGASWAEIASVTGEPEAELRAKYER